jgi:hypothetical protein
LTGYLQCCFYCWRVFPVVWWGSTRGVGRISFASTGKPHPPGFLYGNYSNTTSIIINIPND